MANKIIRLRSLYLRATALAPPPGETIEHQPEETPSHE